MAAKRPFISGKIVFHPHTQLTKSQAIPSHRYIPSRRHIPKSQTHTKVTDTYQVTGTYQVTCIYQVTGTYQVTNLRICFCIYIVSPYRTVMVNL